jgi:hypothetical protein
MTVLTMNLQPRKPFRFTSENARELQRKGVLAKLAQKAAQADLAQRGRDATPDHVKLTKQLHRIEEMMDKTENVDKLAKLIAMHTRLFNSLQLLTNPKGRRSRSAGSVPLAPLSPLAPL